MAVMVEAASITYLDRAHSKRISSNGREFRAKHRDMQRSIWEDISICYPSPEVQMCPMFPDEMYDARINPKSPGFREDRHSKEHTCQGAQG